MALKLSDIAFSAAVDIQSRIPSEKEGTQLQEFPGVIDFKHFLSFTWTLRFKRGQTFHTKNFYFEGTMTDAKCRAYAHCGAMDYTFIQLARFIVDLDHQEKVVKDARNNGTYKWSEAENI